MLKVIQSPAKYIQGPDALYHIGKYTKPLGERALIMLISLSWIWLAASSKTA